MAPVCFCYATKGRFEMAVQQGHSKLGGEAYYRTLSRAGKRERRWRTFSTARLLFPVTVGAIGSLGEVAIWKRVYAPG
ncbi:MAG TPA: hypothetical protein EYG58_01620 [Nitrospirales bacterium]|nr:hypothetical protein [Nitrospirales bacterium]HIN32763.1 hypothetical protein [Nitrospirales bacterium]HIO69231.1 hypothetical protein [Nitrospirales bacterium]